jgi:hypothetical protein
MKNETVTGATEAIVAYGSSDYTSTLGVVRRTSRGWVLQYPQSRSEICWTDWHGGYRWLRRKCGDAALICKIHHIETLPEYSQRMASKKISH